MIASRLVPPVSDDSDEARSLLHALRAEVRAFVVAQRREGRIPPRVDSWLTGWDEEFTFGGEDLDLSARVGRRHPVVYLPRAEITHYGRVSTRQHIGYASSNMAAGFVRYLRKSGCSRKGMLAYKLLVTLDVPVQFVGKGIQYLCRRLRGRKSKADKSLLAMRGFGHFLLKGWWPFWRA